MKKHPAFTCLLAAIVLLTLTFSVSARTADRNDKPSPKVMIDVDQSSDGAVGTHMPNSTVTRSNPSWTDNFDTYAAGSEIIGQGGWAGWDNNPTVGALVSSAYSHSGSNSVEIVGASDLVHEFNYSSGVWTFSCWQYIPSGFTGQSAFIFQNTYNHGGPYNWSTQIQFSSVTGNVSDFDGATMPIVYDQWVELQLVINLDTDMQEFSYNNQTLVTKSWTEGLSGGGALNIAVIDLFANGASAVYYDDLSLTSPVVGAVPTVGEWGMIVMTLLLLSAGAIVMRRRQKHLSVA